MAELPKQEEITEKELGAWYKLKAKLAELKTKEHFERMRIFRALFPNPVEGSKNKHPLKDGYVLKCEHTLNRKVDEGALAALKPEMLKAGIRVDDLFVMKPELKKSEYNKLTEDQLKLVDQCLIIKEGSPQLDIVLPKRPS